MVHLALLASLTLTAAPDRTAAETLTQLVAVSAARASGIQVLSRQDVQDIVALEGDKAAAGCDEGTSCLAEVAGALGARLVIFGQLGALGDRLVLTLNLFDAETAASERRAVARAADLGELSDKIDPLVEELLGSHIAEKDLKLFVMDLSVAGASTIDDAPAQEPTAEAPTGPSGLFVAGAGIAGVGVVAVTVGAVLGAMASGAHATAADPTTTQRAASDLITERDGLALGANIGLIVGAAALVGGGAVLGLALMGGE